MFQTITPIDNSVLLERKYDNNKIEETIGNSLKAQKENKSLFLDFYTSLTTLEFAY